MRLAAIALTYTGNTIDFLISLSLRKTQDKAIKRHMEKDLNFDNIAGIKISIVTACYKSLPFLDRIYQCILQQEHKNIEWITVDDHSPDDTLKKLYELKARNEVTMQVIALSNNTGGFEAAQAGIRAATGRFTLILDHDDEIFPNALSSVLRIWNELSASNEKLYGIWSRCVDENNKLMGNLYKELPKVCENGYFFHVLKCRPECYVLADAELLKEYYVLSETELAKTNGSIWNAMGRNYRAIFTNEITRKYYTNVATSQSNRKTIKNALSYSYQEAEYLVDNKKYFWKDIFWFLKKILIYLNFSYHGGASLKDAVKKLKFPRLKIAAILLVPLSPFVFLKNRYINKRVYD